MAREEETMDLKEGRSVMGGIGREKEKRVMMQLYFS